MSKQKHRMKKLGGRWSKSTFVIELALLALIGPSVHKAAAISFGNVGGHIAYSKAKDSDGNILSGGHLEVMLAPVLGLQGAVDYRSEDRFVLDTEGGTEGLKTRSVPVTVSAHLHLPIPLPVSPFALAGAGWYPVTYDYSPGLEAAFGLKDETVTTFGWHVGAGATMALAPMLKLTGEARYNFVDPSHKLGREVREAIRNLSYDSFNLGVGLSIGL